MSVHELSEKSILKRKRVKQFQNAKVFPGLVGFHSEPNLRDVQISITKKNDLKTLAMKRKMSMSGDISLHTIFDPSLTKSELKNINHLSKFRKEARMSRTASAGKIRVKYPKHQNKFRYTNISEAKVNVQRRNPFRNNFKTAAAIRENLIKEKNLFNSKLLGPTSMRHTKDQAQKLTQNNTDELDKFIERHNKNMKYKKFGKIKLRAPALSKKRDRFRRTFNRLMMSKSMSVLQ